MSIKIQYKGFNLIVHNTDEGFGGNIEPNPVLKVITGKGRFWDVHSYTLPELQVKFEKLVDKELKMNRDNDVILVQQFIEALDKVAKEMEPLDNSDIIG